jgi:MYXO-CTERM domain-containing protein
MHKPGSLVLATLVSLGCFGGAAHALNQAKHQQLSHDGCVDHGLPDRFCRQVGVEAYNVDHYEWDDPAAHGQMADGGTACDGANATMVRELSLGQEIRRHIENIAYRPSKAENDALARAIGRALHTAQDNCAHAGMPNVQHSWASMSDTCDGTSISPDVQPEAIDCARSATDEVMSTVVDTMSDWGLEKASLGQTDVGATHWPSYGDVCNFLGEAGGWDGGDRRWDNTIVDPALRSVLTWAISSDDAYAWDVCYNAPDGILVSWAGDVNVSSGPPSCIKISAFCLGKADEGAADGPPPWETDDVPDAAGGCQVGGGAPGGWLGFAAIGALLAFRRRRGGRVRR